MKLSRRKTAFTLIELLVTVSIMLLLFSTALAAYTRYTEKQRVVAAAEKIESAIREAQNRTKTGYLGNCSQLKGNGVRFWLENGNLIYHLFTICEDNNEDLYEPRVSLGSNFALDIGARVWFVPYGGAIINGMRAVNNFTGVLDENTSVLSSTQVSDYQVTFTLTKGGGIQVDY